MSEFEQKSDVDRVRNLFVQAGQNPEWVNDQVMNLGGEAFVKAGDELFARMHRCKELFEGDIQDLFEVLMERERIFFILGIDITKEGAFQSLMKRIDHLALHSKESGCNYGAFVSSNIPKQEEL